MNGWLLNGFPRTPAQADALRAAGIHADIFIFLHVPDDIVIDRVAGRRTDPKTGKIYHMKFSPPKDKKILDRLVQRSDDTKEKVAIRLEQFHSNVDAFKSGYTDIIVEIQGTKPPDEVAADIEHVMGGPQTLVERTGVPVVDGLLVAGHAGDEAPRAVFRTLLMSSFFVFFR